MRHRGTNISESLIKWQQFLFNTLGPRQNGRHLVDDLFKCIFVNENVLIWIKISLKFVPKVTINNIPALVKIMAWSWLYCRRIYASLGLDELRKFENICKQGVILYQSLCVKPNKSVNHQLRGHTWNMALIEFIWVRSRNCVCLVTWFCYQLIAKPGNKAAAVSWPDPYIIKPKVHPKSIKFYLHFHICDFRHSLLAEVADICSSIIVENPEERSSYSPPTSPKY